MSMFGLYDLSYRCQSKVPLYPATAIKYNVLVKDPFAD